MNRRDAGNISIGLRLSSTPPGTWQLSPVDWQSVEVNAREYPNGLPRAPRPELYYQLPLGLALLTTRTVQGLPPPCSATTGVEERERNARNWYRGWLRAHPFNSVEVMELTPMCLAHLAELALLLRACTSDSRISNLTNVQILNAVSETSGDIRTLCARMIAVRMSITSDLMPKRYYTNARMRRLRNVNALLMAEFGRIRCVPNVVPITFELGVSRPRVGPFTAIGT